MNIFITGHVGQLGSKIYEMDRRENNIFPKNSLEQDICSKEIYDVIKGSDPDIIIHCAAMTNVDACEIETSKADRINHLGTKNIAEISRKLECRLIYISTDFVFDGRKGYYTEKDEPNPISYYGYSKLMGEKEVQKICKDYCIARTSVIYGWHKQLNFASWIICQLRAGNEIKIVTDQYNSPTLSYNIAELLLELSKNDYCGILHLAGNERISRYDFALKTCEVFGLDSRLVKPIESKELNQKAKRPYDSSLDVSMAKSLLRKNILNCRESLEYMKNKEARI